MTASTITRWAIANAHLVIEAAERDDNTGFCISCGAEQSDVEPDMECGCCDSCNEHAVFGAEQLAIYIL